jgi:hypothetical protein
MNISSAEANRAWVRNRIARAGLTAEIETVAELAVLSEVAARHIDDAPDYTPDDDYEAEYLADVFAESAEDYQRNYADNYDMDGRYFGKDEFPEVWAESDANPEG